MCLPLSLAGLMRPLPSSFLWLLLETGMPRLRCDFFRMSVYLRMFEVSFSQVFFAGQCLVHY